LRRSTGFCLEKALELQGGWRLHEEEEEEEGEEGGGGRRGGHHAHSLVEGCAVFFWEEYKGISVVSFALTCL
jgi:hypothetical protein